LRFEKLWAETLKARYCLATSSGTTALITALAALDVGPGDEVIVPPYTFVATVNAVLVHFGVPIFVDTDPDTFQIDPTKIERAITPRTKVILPVHIGGSPADMDRILAIGKKHGIPVLEDACQAHMAEWRKQKVSTLGAAGCFSFQASKNLNSGEGGAIISNDEGLIHRCWTHHNNGRGFGPRSGSYTGNGANYRMTEFQAALLAEQLTRVEEQSQARERNARHLSKLLKQIGGLKPAGEYEGCTRNAYHLYMARYDASQFEGMPRAQFLKAMRAEGIGCGGGHEPLNKEPFLAARLQSRHYRNTYPESALRDYQERNACPENDKLCKEAVWLTQTMLLGSTSDMEQIAAAVEKVKKNARALAKS
jgi:perosamine synthetase